MNNLPNKDYIFVNLGDNPNDRHFAYVNLKNNKVFFASDPKVIVSLLSNRFGIQMLRYKEEDDLIFIDMDWVKDLEELVPCSEQLEKAKTLAIEFAKKKENL